MSGFDFDTIMNARDDALYVLAFYKNYIRNCETCICACTRKAIVDIDKLRQINPDYKCPRFKHFLYLSQRFLKKLHVPVIQYTALSRFVRVFFFKGDSHEYVTEGRHKQ